MKKLISLLLLSATSALAQYTIGLSTQAYKGQDTGITFSPVAGAVSNPTTVTFSGAIAGSIYCSTQDGSTPATNLIGTACNNGSLGSTTSITTAVTVKVVSGLLGDMDSPVGSAAYTISGGGHAMAVIQTFSCGSITGSSFTCSLSATGSGHNILLGCYINSGALTSTTPSSTQLFGNSDAGIWTIQNISSGVTSISVTVGSGPNNSTCIGAEVSGVVTAASMDVASTYANLSSGGGNSSAFTGSITTTNANDAVLGFVLDPSHNTAVFTPGTGYTTIGTGTYSTNANTVYMEYTNVSSTGAYNPGATYTPTTDTVYGGTTSVKLQ